MTEDPAGGGGFAQRWSRLKRASRVPAPPPLDAPEGVVPAVVVPETLAPDIAPPDAIVELPPPAESIALEDITAWLSRPLPEGWREAALRRLWSADSGIRDFVGPADYAWDWNTPGGAPGWTPMRVADDIARLLSRAIGEPLPVNKAMVVAEETGPVAEAGIAPATEEAGARVEDVHPEDSQIVSAPQIKPEPAHPATRRGGRAAPV